MCKEKCSVLPFRTLTVFFFIAQLVTQRNQDLAGEFFMSFQKLAQRPCPPAMCRPCEKVVNPISWHLPRTFSCISATKVNFPTETLHVYFPSAASWMFVNCRVPSVRPGNTSFDFSHLTVCCAGLVVTRHSTSLSAPSVVFRTSGGLTNSITSTLVSASSKPTLFVASHLYRPASCFVALSILSCPSSTSLWEGKLPPTLDHLTTGVGEPVTWHLGRVTVVFSSTKVGPFSRSMRGATKTEKHK